MAYDPQIDRVLLFCGYDTFVSGHAWQHELDLKARDEWAYDVGATRMERWAVTPAVIYQQVVYDKRALELISFGPENTRVYNMATRTWEKTNPAEEPPTFRFWYDLAYDRESDRIILFGGDGEGIQLHDTWAYDYENNLWTEMSPRVSPPGRWGHGMAYDSESDRVIMWGASEVGRTPMSDEEKETIWAYDYETNTWTVIHSTGGPSYRGCHTMVYHPGTDQIILFGGHHQGDVSFSDETWAYDYNTNTWTQLDPASHPSGRRLHDMVYGEAADKMVLFGGIAGNWLKEEINDELWVFDPVADEWSQVTPDSLNP
jgi:N-acetylneuraminic acid mutarotase